MRVSPYSFVCPIVFLAAHLIDYSILFMRTKFQSREVLVQVLLTNKSTLFLI